MRQQSLLEQTNMKVLAKDEKNLYDKMRSDLPLSVSKFFLDTLGKGQVISLFSKHSLLFIRINRYKYNNYPKQLS